jgi:hypothetical protein
MLVDRRAWHGDLPISRATLANHVFMPADGALPGVVAEHGIHVLPHETPPCNARQLILAAMWTLELHSCAFLRVRIPHDLSTTFLTSGFGTPSVTQLSDKRAGNIMNKTTSSLITRQNDEFFFNEFQFCYESGHAFPLQAPPGRRGNLPLN